MKKIFLLHVVLFAFSASAHAEQKVYVAAGKTNYSINVSAKVFQFSSQAFKKEIPIRDCNRVAFTRTWRQIQKNSRLMSTDKQSTPHDVMVNIADHQHYLGMNSDGGRYFRALPGKILALGIESDQLCAGNAK